MPYEYLFKAITLVILPLIPAVVIFKVFPTSRAGGEGPLGGIQWKLGGAFAGYVLVSLLLVIGMKVTPNEVDAEVWTVTGRVELEGAQNLSPNLLTIRAQPQKLNVAADGSFIVEVVGQRVGGELVFPRLTLDMSAVCYVAKTIALDGSVETFLSDQKPVDFRVQRLGATRQIRIGVPIKLERAKAGAYGPCPA